MSVPSDETLRKYVSYRVVFTMQSHCKRNVFTIYSANPVAWCIGSKEMHHNNLLDSSVSSGGTARSAGKGPGTESY